MPPKIAPPTKEDILSDIKARRPNAKMGALKLQEIKVLEMFLAKIVADDTAALFEGEEWTLPPEPQAEAQHKPTEELATHEVEKIVEREGHARQQVDDQTGAIGEGARIHGRYTPAMIYHHQMRKQLAQWNRHNLYYPYQNTVRNHGKSFLMLNRSAHYD